MRCLGGGPPFHNAQGNYLRTKVQPNFHSMAATERDMARLRKVLIDVQVSAAALSRKKVSTVRTKYIILFSGALG